MHATADSLEFAPPAQPGMVRALALAVIAHILLMLALTWGITWNRDTTQASAEAELWSSVPQEAAPQAVAPPVVQAPPVQPPPPPVEKAAPPPPPPAVKEADIAIEREKKKQELARQHQEELERQKKLEARRRQEELKREQLAEKKAAEEKKRKEEQAKADKLKKQQAEDEKRAEARRAAQIARAQGMAGATGAPTATGNAQRSAGVSAGYAGRIVARVRPNIVFTDDVAGNPMAEVEVRTSPDGTIVGRRIVRSSGVPAWDNAVLRALDKTEVLPRDTDGRVPSPMILEFKPRS